MVYVYRHVFQSAIGDILLLSSERGLCFVGLPGIAAGVGEAYIGRTIAGADIVDGFERNRRVCTQLKSYFEGKLTRFELDIDLRVEGFTRDVLAVVAEIPYGEVRTYKEIARLVGQPGAAQAVGNANGANPIPILIPCHRVVAANGLGGYSGGLALKKKLLAIEQRNTLF